MFEIEYKGANSVIISTKKAKLVVDPKLSIVGLKDISTKGTVELATESRFAINDSDSILSIESPGEYGVAEFDIRGIAARRHIDTESQGKMSTIYRVEIGEARIGIVGNIDKTISDEQLEELGVLDILIIPIGGGGYTLDAADAADVVRMIDPKIVVPVHYADSSLKYEVPQDALQLFITELGVPVETVSKYKLKQLPIIPATLSIVEITRS
ncbi:Zn-dependent hydrolase [Candidatus Saccharibacteria bacterium CG11_big_fil_rev_8_21_14_0_20_41_19]|nr:Zn-dependent hydrolase [Candidatus Saccharibacteria bacterium]OIP85693.1 MAG: Zn-dependent hydrolase [Candidatus Saccharibacteria bacterium CG2_30_41_52]PIQ70564.1 MAG: Zn-dependent hydrolase [Candidatus Saccharibacteria bacterium CG11_big_fil_rev_8_21_14_0_20_41_19]PIZ60856.1 MAG: Zn-dependent hydrolase [Candidatus Saccharibacteria bacterium CG_4_10_14_0_2_um_filter_41_11]PJC29459.1 MAG: Zn-dependent hydrolase [Candidatus Saccharibacteria bacterium CG_4_9_14_0_2_um_filter_41_9]PJE66350.1 M